MRKLKLMADYECFPLWENYQNELENINPNSLNITKYLQDSLIKWATIYDATLNQDYPPDSGFTTEDEEAEFEQEGKRIFAELAFQLKDGFELSYFSQKESKIINTIIKE